MTDEKMETTGNAILWFGIGASVVELRHGSSLAVALRWQFGALLAILLMYLLRFAVQVWRDRQRPKRAVYPPIVYGHQAAAYHYFVPLSMRDEPPPPAPETP